MMYPTLDDWIRQESIPFTTDSPDTFNAAVDRLIASCGDIDLLAFGEALHGGEEILMLRNRLFQRLVEAHGYSAVAMESSFPRAHAVNEYVMGRGAMSYEAIADSGYSYGFRQLEANRELVEWMRAYNADETHPVKLRFYGADSPTEMVGTDSPRQVLHFALDYLDAMAVPGSSQRRERIDALIGDDFDWENPAAMMDPAKAVGLSPAASALRIETEDLITELKIRRPELVSRSDRERYLEALQYARLARQLLNYHAGLASPSDERLSELLGIRDVVIADNLVYFVNRERGRGGKVLVFAHNRHLQRSRLEWQLGPHHIVWWSAGAQLHEVFGRRYVVIGSALGMSDENGIGQPETGTLEALLDAASGNTALFIPTHGGEGLPASEIAALPVRAPVMKNSTYGALTAQSFTEFDWIAFVHSTTYQRGGNPLP